MALREELDNYNAEIVVGPEDDPQVTNAQLAVEEWNRTTVADGAWLQQNAIGPLSARDIVLANAIDDTNDALAELSGKMADVDGRSLKSINGRFFSGGSEIWQGSDPAIVPDGTGVKNDEVIYVPQNDGVILSMNDDGGHAHQLKIKENEIGYRYLAGTSTAEGQGNIPGAKYKYDTQAGNFIPLIKKSDLPQEDVWFGIKNGDFAPLDYPSADNVSIGVNENNQLYVKHLSNPMWVKTSDGAIDGSAMDEDNETYLHGSDITTVSAIRSTIIGSQTKLHNVAYSNLIVGGTNAGEDSSINGTFGYLGGCKLGPSAKIDSSVTLGGGVCISAGNKVAYSLILENATFESSETAPWKTHEGIINLDGSNRFVNTDKHNDDVIVAGGGNQISACRQLGIFGNNNKMDDLENTVFAGGGADVSGTHYTFLLGNGGVYQKNLDNSFIACGGAPGNYLSNISTSVVNLSIPYVDKVEHSLLLGTQPTFSGYSDESPLNYCIIDGLYTSACYGAPIYTVALGNGNEISRANRSLILGEYTQTKGRNCINNGYANSAYGNYAILQGRENTMGNFDYGMAIGEENKLWNSYQVAVGSGNMLVNSNYQVAIGVGNVGEKPNTLTIGNYNINGSYDSLLVGDNISAWGAGHAFVLGNDNKVTDQNVALIGNGLHTSRGNQVQIGKYNVGYGDSILEISWGDSDANRKTLFRVTTAGDVYVAGTLHTEVGPMIGG